MSALKRVAFRLSVFILVYWVSSRFFLYQLLHDHKDDPIVRQLLDNGAKVRPEAIPEIIVAGVLTATIVTFAVVLLQGVVHGYKGTPKEIERPKETPLTRLKNFLLVLVPALVVVMVGLLVLNYLRK